MRRVFMRVSKGSYAASQVYWAMHNRSRRTPSFLITRADLPSTLQAALVAAAVGLSGDALPLPAVAVGQCSEAQGERAQLSCHTEIAMCSLTLRPCNNLPQKQPMTLVKPLAGATGMVGVVATIRGQTTTT